MNNSTDRRPTIDEWISQYTQLTNRYPSGGEIEDAIHQGVVRGEGPYNTAFAPPVPYTGTPSAARKAFSMVALVSLLVAFIALWLPVTSFLGQSIGWFDAELADEGILLLVATLLSAVFIGAHLVARKKWLKNTAAIISIPTGAFLAYDGLINLSNLGQFGGPGLLLMGLAGIALIVAAVGILATE